MPTHVYKPKHDPPTWWDRLLVHPMDTGVAVLAIQFSALIAVSVMVPGFVPSKSMDQLEMWVVILVAAALGNGGLLAVIGLNWRGDEVSHGWALERFGWILAASGFAAYSLTVLTHFPDSLFSWAVPAALGLMSGLRLWAVFKIERSMRHTIALVEGEARE